MTINARVKNLLNYFSNTSFSELSENEKENFYKSKNQLKILVSNLIQQLDQKERSENEHRELVFYLYLAKWELGLNLCSVELNWKDQKSNLETYSINLLQLLSSVRNSLDFHKAAQLLDLVVKVFKADKKNEKILGITYFLLGLLYYYGYSINKDKNKAVECFQRAADKGDIISLTLLGFHYKNQATIFANENKKKAFAYFHQAATLGDAVALRELGDFYYFNIDDRKAFVCFHQAATLGDIIALRKLGDFYYQGLGVNKDKKKGIEYLKQAADKGDRIALRLLDACRNSTDANKHEKAAKEQLESSATHIKYHGIMKHTANKRKNRPVHQSKEDLNIQATKRPCNP